MTQRVPEWLRHREVDVDRLFCAAWLLLMDERDAGLGIAASLGVDEPALQQVAEGVSDYLACDGDPCEWAWVRHEITSSNGYGWETWRELELDSLFADLESEARRALRDAHTVKAAA